ncbi:MAG TPA: sensor domain-containing diguanylate cyclase [Acidimicrobiales bacterium]|nr:sensor domain-containing diguanylate cyclase [Acidimicrobiales bacterium]
MLTESHWEDARRRRARVDRITGTIGVLGLGVFTLPAMAAGILLGHGAWRYVIAATTSILLGIPMVVVMIKVSQAQALKADDNLRDMSRQLNAALERADEEVARRDAQAEAKEFETRLANALDMADGEPEVIEVIERSLATVLPGRSTELLLADNSQAHLVRMAAVGLESDQCGCRVDSPSSCPAARRAQIQVFANSTALDACPKLRQRPGDDRSAVCVPVSIMGRTVGVIHSTVEEPGSPTEDQVHGMATLAKLAGARIGMLRAMAETQLQASTDTLTGLLNRRSFEQRLGEIRRLNPTMSLAMADLDHFKKVNDTYGHETGDSALRLFARILTESVRGDDLICRYGGEEFAIAFASCSAADARRALDAVRTRLDAAVTVSGLPKFTASFGITEMPSSSDFKLAMARADAALLLAKRQGRDRIVLDSNSDDQDGSPGLRARAFEAADDELEPPTIELG